MGKRYTKEDRQEALKLAEEIAPIPELTDRKVSRKMERKGAKTMEEKVETL